MGLQGGYYEVEEPKLGGVFFDVPLYFVNGTYVRFPTLDDVESNVSAYVETKIFNCLNNFSAFDNLEIEYKENETNVSLSITDGNVFADLFLPIVLSRGESRIIKDEFYVKVSSDFKNSFDAAEEYVEVQKLEPNNLRIGYLDNITKEAGLKVEVEIYSDGNALFMFVGDEADSLFSKYTFIFGIKYNLEGE